MKKIPFNKASISRQSVQYLLKALSRPEGLSGDGPYTERCQKELRRLLRVEHVVLTSSCTHALELSGLLLNIQPGDEVILPSFTFPATANAFLLRGARPRLVDIRPDTLNLDERLLEAHITPRTRVILAVHYAGVPSQMNAIVKIARQHNLVVVEDAAQALGATFREKPAGTWGDLAAFSFHGTKNVTCGEGGALVIRNKQFMRRAEILRQHGTNRSAYLRGEVKHYSWVDVGSSYVPSELQAAFLLSQLESFASIQRRRRQLYEKYFSALKPYAEQGRLQLPVIPPDCQSSHHIFYLLLATSAHRDRVLTGLRRKGVQASLHYVPLHLSKMGQYYGYKSGMCPVSENASQRLLRLPLYDSMTRAEQHYVLRCLRDVL